MTAVLPSPPRPGLHCIYVAGLRRVPHILESVRGREATEQFDAEAASEATWKMFLLFSNM